MLTPATGALRYKNSKRQKIVAREQVAFLSLFSNVVEAVDLQKESLIMEETENVAEKIKKIESELKPNWEPSTFKALFCHLKKPILLHFFQISSNFYIKIVYLSE